MCLQSRQKKGVLMIGYAKLMKPERLKKTDAAIAFDEMRLLPNLIEKFNLAG